MADQPRKARTVAQQAERYGHCNSFVRKWIQRGKIPIFVRGGVQYIYDDDMDAFMCPPAEVRQAG